MRPGGIIGITLCFVLFFLLGLFSGRRMAPEAQPVEIRDTVTVVDTAYIDRPVPKYVSIIKRDTVKLRYFKIRHDTVLAEVPIERKIYQEDSVFRAVVSGPRCGDYEPSLDTLIVYPTITTITVTKPVEVRKPAPKFSFGITAGPSVLATPQGNVHAGLGATIGLSYRF